MCKVYTEKMKKQVAEILRTPIVSSNKNQGIIAENILEKNGNKHTIIKSTQKYNPKCLDPDMSDFAIGFYKIIYEKDIINASGQLINCCFAGDTMNSFNSIANITPNAGISKKLRTKQDSWRKELKKYHNNYHCLANFWILPMCIGRKSMKLNKYDSMDIFLSMLVEDKSYENTLGSHKEYYIHFRNYNEFFKKHFLGSYDKIRKYPYNETNWLNLINQAQERIKARAYQIAESEFGPALWKYFNDLKLFNT